MSRESEERSERDGLPEHREYAEHAEYPEYPEYAERVLVVTERIPPGRVMTYGDVAEWLAQEIDPEAAPVPGGGGRGVGGPRQVGRVMALYGEAVPWWRVVRADGTLLPGHERQALAHYRAEGTPLREAARTRPAPDAAESGGSGGGQGRRGARGASGARGRTSGELPRLDMRRARWDGADPPPGGSA
ncbi:MGMT family protein [Streptomyces zagrosensis]|uniref:Alkylated DNA nucleotide flippase Atl1 n=1 Tax=Streptomyces zagrosensis TaxID=1042984 RepID=A0A7W9UZA2_9ACTN|nr:MGMT family protein [Streptomyces zagrosensis]MBB5936810.1 alkylated DNA nucleotide flippase Atl1 [Streptomyces zagrosensis]